MEECMKTTKYTMSKNEFVEKDGKRYYKVLKVEKLTSKENELGIEDDDFCFGRLALYKRINE
jgi:hypothetical protein